MKSLVLFAAVALAACGTNNIGNDAGNPADSGNADGGPDGGPACAQFLPPPFQCTGTAAGLTYPQCPYGTSQGHIFPDTELTGAGSGGGFFDPNMSVTETPGLDLPTQYQGNPTTAPAFNSTMAFHMLYCAKAAGFKYALLDVSAVWCPHCNTEAQYLPACVTSANCLASQGVTVTGKWQSRGGIVFSILVQGSNTSNAATLNDLYTWVNMYGINYPMSIDPQESMVTTVNLQGWPTNVIIKLDDMTVVDSVFGSTWNLFQEFDSLLQ
jgi:hypothetical protein